MQRKEELRGIIDAGHTPDAHVVRLVTDTHQPLKFSVWGAKAIAGIGKLESTIMDRSLIFEMRRRLPHEEVEKLRDAEPSLFDNLATKLARFRLDYSEAISSQKPKLPDALNDRAQDNWHPLLSIADVAGGTWPEQARKTALLLSGVSDSNEEEGVGVALLADLRELFTDKKEEAKKKYESIDRITSQEVVAGLCAELEKRWATHNLHHGHDRTITPRQIAMILKNFKIAPRTLNLTGGKGAKGYHFKDFEDAFKRYLPEPSPAAVEAKPL